MTDPTTSDLFAHAAARAIERRFFLASALSAFQEFSQMDDGGLARYLGCPIGSLTLLRLCRRPDVAAPQFQHDVRWIGERFDIDAIALVRLLREVASVEAMRASGDDQRSAGFLMAARDKRRRPRTQR